MPFIDDTLLWCPDNDGRMVDISACLQVRMLVSLVDNVEKNIRAKCDFRHKFKQMLNLSCFSQFRMPPE